MLPGSDSDVEPSDKLPPMPIAAAGSGSDDDSAAIASAAASLSVLLPTQVDAIIALLSRLDRSRAHALGHLGEAEAELAVERCASAELRSEVAALVRAGPRGLYA